MKGGQGVTENLRCARRHASQSEKFAVNEGLDAPTPARVVGLPPRRGSTFFRSERKYQRKHAARRLREKGFYCPFCRRGSQRRAQWSWTAIPNACARSCARLFPPSKWAGLFPSAAYRRPAPAQLAGDILNPCRVGCFGVACVFSQGKRPAGNQIHAGLLKRAMRPIAEWRSGLANKQEVVPDRRAARPSAERR